MKAHTIIIVFSLVLLGIIYSHAWGEFMGLGWANRMKNHRHYAMKSKSSWTRAYWLGGAESSRFSTDKDLTAKEKLAAKSRGPNVCVTRRLSGSSKSCVTVNNVSNCTRNNFYQTAYYCCPGYANQFGKKGCPKELYVSTKNIVEVAKNLKLAIFVDLIKTAGLTKTFSSGGRFTVFAPTDDAFKAMGKGEIEKLKSNTKKLSKFLMFHVVNGKLPSNFLKDDTKIKTLNTPYKVRVNVFARGRIIIVQGARIVKKNQGATNGLIHVINKVITPSSKTAIQVLKANKHLKMFYQAVVKSGLSFTNPVTVFAPTDDAFNKLSKVTLARILNSPVCLKNLLKNHITSESVFTSVIKDGQRAYIQTSNENTVSMTKTKGVAKINNATIITADVLVTDGVVHVIDKVLVPTSALTIVDAAEREGATEFVKLIKKAGLDKTLNTKRYTLIAPTNKAINSLPEEFKAKLADAKFLKQILSYHVINGSRDMQSFQNEELVETSDKSNKIRINLYNYGQTVSLQGSCMQKLKCYSACNGMVHFVHKVMIPPSKTILQTINSNKNLSTLAAAIEKAGLQKALNGTRPLTVFAPTNQAFMNLPTGSLEKLMSDPVKLRRFLTYHVMPSSLFSCGFPEYGRLRTLNGRTITVHKAKGVISINDATIINADVGVTNGVLHTLNKVLRDRRRFMSFWNHFFREMEQLTDF